MKKNKKIFICCTEQSGENIAYNICKRLEKYNYQIDGVGGQLSQKYFTKSFKTRIYKNIKKYGWKYKSEENKKYFW